MIYIMKLFFIFTRKNKFVKIIKRNFPIRNLFQKVCLYPFNIEKFKGETKMLEILRRHFFF